MDIKKIYEHIDYTLLKSTVTNNDIWNLCEEAEKNTALPYVFLPLM